MPKNKCKMCDRTKCWCYEDLAKKLHRVSNRQKTKREWKKEAKSFMMLDRTGCSI